MDAWWKSWNEVRGLVKGKRVVFYGRSEDWVPKALPELPAPPEYLVDGNAAYDGTEFYGIGVSKVDRLAQDTANNIYVLITAGSYTGIVETLIDMGLQPGQQFCCCPAFRDYAYLEAMRVYEQQIIVTSPDYKDRSKTRYSRAGGGIFRYHLGSPGNEIEPLAQGNFRQIVANGRYFYAVEFNECKVYVFDRDFKVVEKFALDRPHYCGIEFDPKRKLLVLVNSGTDMISFHDAENFALVDRIHFSEKSDETGPSHHHLNDACVAGDEMFVSYFSRSGNWKRNIFDGGISQYNLERLDEPSVQMVDNLWMPHSPKIINGNLCYLESAPGKLYLANYAVTSRFPGFARGLAFDGRYYYIGQSETMYLGRLFGTADTIMMNAGIYLFDAETRASRFYPMLDNMNVHDLMVLPAA